MLKPLVTVAVAALCFSGVGHADLLYNNLGNPPGTGLGTFPIGGDGPEGDSFSTGPTGFFLKDVTLALMGSNDSAGFTVSLYSDNSTVCAPGPSCSGGPGVVLDTIANVSDGSIPSALTDDHFALAIPYQLAADTRYWIIASSTDGSGVLWSYTEDLSGTGVTGEFNITSTVSPIPNSDDFTTYPSCSNGDFGPPGQNACTPYQMEVSGTPVPEPASWLLFITVLTGFGLALSRRMSGPVHQK